MARKPALAAGSISEQNQSVNKIPLRSSGGDGTDDSMEARVAVLEQIAKDTKDVLNDIKAEIRDLRGDFKDMRGEIKEVRNDMKTEFRDVRARQRSDFLWLLGAIAGLFALMAHGFHWF